jgi:hypothetical protein
MPYTDRTRLEQIEPGEQLDTWGVTQNRTLIRVDEALKGALTFTLSGDRALIYSNDDTDEAHYAALNVTGGVGGRILLQPQQGWFIVHNAASGPVTVTITGVQGTIVEPGATTIVLNDGVSSVYQISPSSTKSLKQYVDDGLAAERAYANGLAFEAVDGQLPAQTGNAGRFMRTNGTTANWEFVTIDTIQGLSAKLAEQNNFAIAAAAIL